MKERWPHMRHQGQKILSSEFDRIWQLLHSSGEQRLETAKEHDFVAFAESTEKGSHRGDKVIRIKTKGKEFARIYPCCWGHSINCNGTRIGGYSDALDRWAQLVEVVPHGASTR